MNTKKPIKDPISGLLNAFTSQIRYDVYEATVKLADPESVTASELNFARVLINKAWEDFASAVNQTERELDTLVQGEKWDKAQIFLLELKLSMKEFESSCLKESIMSDYVLRCIETGTYKSLDYSQWCGALTYKDVLGTCNISKMIAHKISTQSFYLELCKMWGFAKAVTEKMERILFQSRYKKKFNKFSEKTITIYDVFVDGQSLIYALRKFETTELMVMTNNKPVLTTHERGRKRLVLGWLKKCYGKGFINAAYDATTTAKVVLTYFGFAITGDNDVRDFLGDNLPTKYIDVFGKWK